MERNQARVHVHDFQDPLVGFVTFQDPLVGRELWGRSLRASLRAVEENTLDVVLSGGEIPEVGCRVRFEELPREVTHWLREQRALTFDFSERGDGLKISS